MTIGWRTPGAWNNGSTTVTPALPASPAAGDRMILFVGAKPYTATINQPTGWTRIGTQQTNGTAANATDGGSVTWSVFFRDWQSGDAAPAVSITSGNTALACIHGATKTQAGWGPVDAYFGSDTSSGTDYSITASGSSGGIINGDGLIHATVIAGNNSTFATPTISATSATIDAVTESPATEGSTVTGLDLEASSATALCTAGASTADAVAGWTLSAAQTGGSALVRLREMEPPLAGSLGLTGIAPAITAPHVPTPGTGSLELSKDGDPVYASNVLLLHADTDTTDSSPSPKTMTANGNAAVSSAQSVFGGGSFAFDGTGDWIDTPAHADFNMGSGDFDISFRVRFNNAAGTREFICGQGDATGTFASESFFIQREAAGTILAECRLAGAAVGQIRSTTAPAANTWYAVQYVRNGNNFNLRINGVAEGGTVSSSSAITSATNKLSVGRYGELPTDPLNGYIDEFSIVKGAARYTSNYTPAVAAFDPASSIAPVVTVAQAPVVPSAGALALTGAAPVVAVEGGTIRPDTGALALTGIAPTVLLPIAIAPAAGALALTGIAPVAGQSVTVTPATGELTLTGIAPIVAAVTAIVPGTGALSIEARTYATLNPNDKGSGITLNANLLNLVSGGSGNNGVRATIGKTSGKWYWEYSNARYGVSGAANESYLVSTNTQESEQSWVLTAAGQKVHYYTSASAGTAWGTSAVIGFALDADSQTITFYQNGAEVGSYTDLTGTTLYPVVGHYSGSNDGSGLLNFGASAFTYAPPSGYNAGVYSDAAGGFAPTVTQTFSITPTAGALSLTGIAPAVAGSLTITPTAGALALTGIAPTITAHVTVTPTVGSLSLTGIAPTVTRLTAITPAVGSLALTGIAPAIARQDTSTPAVGSLALTGVAPTVRSGTVLTPTVGSLALTGVAPAVTRQDMITPAVGTLALTGIAPVVTRQDTIAPSAGALTLTGVAPSVSQTSADAITPTAGALALTGIAPSVTRQDTQTPAVGALTLTGIAPLVTRQNAIAPSAGALALTGAAPALIAGTMRTPVAGALTLTGGAPTLRADTGRVPTAGALVLTGIAPTVIRNTIITPAVGALALTGAAPSIVRHDTIAPTAGSLTLTGQLGGINGQLAITPAPGTLALTGAAPTIVRVDTLTPSAAALTLTGAAPSVTQQIARTPAAGSLALTGAAPSATRQDSITPNAGALALTGNAPTVTQQLARTPSAGALSLTGAAPSVTQQIARTPNPAALSLTGVAPTVTATQSALAPTAGTLALTGAAPSVTQQAAITPSAGAMALTGSAPVVTALSGVITPSTASLALTGNAPDLIELFSVTAGAGTLSLTGQAPDIAVAAVIPGDPTLNLFQLQPETALHAIQPDNTLAANQTSAPLHPIAPWTGLAP